MQTILILAGDVLGVMDNIRSRMQHVSPNFPGGEDFFSLPESQTRPYVSSSRKRQSSCPPSFGPSERDSK